MDVIFYEKIILECLIETQNKVIVNLVMTGWIDGY